ncbi:MAG: hypothetical protein IJW53_05320 [Clostridia bacterium]|nr:hypothetical protein [Clostridia bacterium]
MTKKKLLKLSLITLIIGICVLAIAYFFFHFVTDEGITLVWHPEAGKPFVTDMIGQLGVLFLFSSAMSAISALVFFGEDKKE